MKPGSNPIHGFKPDATKNAFGPPVATAQHISQNIGAEEKKLIRYCF